MEMYKKACAARAKLLFLLIVVFFTVFVAWSLVLLDFKFSLRKL